MLRTAVKMIALDIIKWSDLLFESGTFVFIKGARRTRIST